MKLWWLEGNMSSIKIVEQTAWTGGARAQGSIAVNDAQLVETMPVVSAGLARFIRRALALALIATPLAFGGVHAAVYAPLEIALFVAATAVIVGALRSSAEIPRCRGRTARVLLATATCVLALALGRTAWTWLHDSAHPVFGTAVSGAALAPALRGIREFVFFGAVVFLVRVALIGRPFAVGALINLILVSGIGCAFIGLAHWFYDTGRLFWFFEPENIFISDRARWPFVNSNHLAAFLLPTFFLLLARLGEGVYNLRDVVVSGRTGRPRKLADIVSSVRAHRVFISLGGWGICLIATTMCILATLSRGAWISTAGGIIFFLLAEGRTRRTVARPEEIPQVVPHASSRRSKRRRRSGQRSPLAPLSSFRVRRLGLAAALIALVVGAYSSIGDRGADLIERRVEYGLLHSKEDMRLQLMSDTKPILHEHLIFGVGLGGWANEYARHMSPLLSGIDPVYLHNEPAQLLVELGIVGLAPLLAGIVTVAWFVASSLTTSRDRLIRLALLTGILATLLATLFDFHLRIPAIVLQLAVLTGLISFLTDSEEPRTPAHLGK
jgi:hypothetical protein